MIATLKLILFSMKLSIARNMAYRANFFTSFFTMAISEFGFPVISMVLYGMGASFPGWSLYELLLMQGIYIVSKGASFTLFGGMMFTTFYQVRMGTFDIILLRPRSTLLLLMVQGFIVHDLGRVLGGGVLLAVALHNLPSPNAMQWAGFIALFILSCVMLFSVILFMTSLVFRWVGVDRIFNIYGSVVNFGLYPTSIFPRSLRVVISFIIPVAILAFFPASAMLGKPTEGILIVVAMTVIFMFSSILFWRHMIKNYTSAGG